jgi:hypothetical protein
VSYPEDFDDLLLDTKAQFMQLAPKVQVAYCLHRLEAEVNNGGFHQFFSNSTGEYVTETMEALVEIGAMKTSELLLPVILRTPVNMKLQWRTSTTSLRNLMRSIRSFSSIQILLQTSSTNILLRESKVACSR